MRGLISFLAAAAAVVCQLSIMDRIAFPGGTGPDLVLIVVAALGLASGPLAGTLTGFWAGLALDVAPPGSHFVGQDALVFCLIGYACGLLADQPSGDGVTEQGHPALFEIGVTAAGAICGEALAALLGVMLSDPRVTWSAINHVLPVAAAYDAVACPFVLYAVAGALRLSGVRGQGKGWIGGQAAAARPAPKREPRLKLGRGSLAGGGLGAAFATSGSVSGPARVRFGARSTMGRSLLGGSVFSRPSRALGRPAPLRRSSSPGRFLSPRFARTPFARSPFSKGTALRRLTGALRKPARPRSPGKGWLRDSSSRTFGSRTFARKSSLGSRAFNRGGPARLHMPRRKAAKRNWRTGGWR